MWGLLCEASSPWSGGYNIHSLLGSGEALQHQLALESLIDSSVLTPCVLEEHLAPLLRVPVTAVAVKLAAVAASEQHSAVPLVSLPVTRLVRAVLRETLHEVVLVLLHPSLLYLPLVWGPLRCEQASPELTLFSLNRKRGKQRKIQNSTNCTDIEVVSESACAREDGRSTEVAVDRLFAAWTSKTGGHKNAAFARVGCQLTPSRTGARSRGTLLGSVWPESREESTEPLLLRWNRAGRLINRTQSSLTLSSAFVVKLSGNTIFWLFEGTRHQCEVPGRTGSNSRCLGTTLDQLVDLCKRILS